MSISFSFLYSELFLPKHKFHQFPVVVMTTELTNNEQNMTDLQKEIDNLNKRMDESLAELTKLENHHNKCEFTESTTL